MEEEGAAKNEGKLAAASPFKRELNEHSQKYRTQIGGFKPTENKVI